MYLRHLILPFTVLITISVFLPVSALSAPGARGTPAVHKPKNRERVLKAIEKIKSRPTPRNRFIQNAVVEIDFGVVVDISLGKVIRRSSGVALQNDKVTLKASLDVGCPKFDRAFSCKTKRTLSGCLQMRNNTNGKASKATRVKPEHKNVEVKEPTFEGGVREGGWQFKGALGPYKVSDLVQRCKEAISGNKKVKNDIIRWQNIRLFRYHVGCVERYKRKKSKFSTRHRDREVTGLVEADFQLGCVQ